MGLDIMILPHIVIKIVLIDEIELMDVNINLNEKNIILFD